LPFARATNVQYEKRKTWSFEKVSQRWEARLEGEPESRHGQKKQPELQRCHVPC
jgi:hypothetical protein